MTRRASKFTPSALLSAPRRGPAIPNSTGSEILYTVSTYDFDHHEKTNEVRLLKADDNTSVLVTDEKSVSSLAWLDDETIIVLQSGDQGSTKVLVGNPSAWTGSYEAASIDGPIGDLKVKKIGKWQYAVAVSGPSNLDGTLFNPETASKRHTTGRVYNSLFVRHWDTYVTPQRNAIFYGALHRDEATFKYKLSKLDNLLAGTGLESPIPPFGGTDHFDVSENSIIFAAKDPDISPASNTKCSIYLARILNFARAESDPVPVVERLPSPSTLETEDESFEGAVTSPVFSADGKSAAFLKMRTNGYESDKNHLIVIPDLTHPVPQVRDLVYSKKPWDKSPSSVLWSADGTLLYLVAEDTGRTVLFALPASEYLKPRPWAITGPEGSVSSVSVLAPGKLIVTFSNLVDNSAYYLVHHEATAEPKLISSNTKNGSTLGLSCRQIDQLWWSGAREGTKVHAWVVLPSDFDPKQRYPLAYLIHGGPQGAWEDSWSTRWNPAVFAEQGYVVVCPNPTGSTGYGQAFTDAIQNNWGGLPYQDLVLGFEYIAKNVDYIDTDRAVALGASYGGYMMNWIQGQPLGRKFKALVTHDGVYSMASQMASEELYFPEHEFGGKWWKNPAGWLKWDPSKFTDNWATPHLVIHSDKDYRLTMAEGLAAFNVLQERGVPSRFLTFPDENHWVLNPENSLLWHAVVLDWINKFVDLPPPSKLDPRLAEVLEEASVPAWGSHL